MKKASVVLIEKDNKFLSIVRSNGKIGLPGGKSEGTETPEQTAIRECFEETGLKVKEMELLFSEVVPGDVPYLTSTFVVKSYEGDLVESKEGKLVWESKENLRSEEKCDFYKYNENVLTNYFIHLIKNGYDCRNCYFEVIACSNDYDFNIILNQNNIIYDEFIGGNIFNKNYKYNVSSSEIRITCASSKDIRDIINLYNLDFSLFCGENFYQDVKDNMYNVHKYNDQKQKIDEFIEEFNLVFG